MKLSIKKKIALPLMIVGSLFGTTAAVQLTDAEYGFSVSAQGPVWQFKNASSRVRYGIMNETSLYKVDTIGGTRFLTDFSYDPATGFLAFEDNYRKTEDRGTREYSFLLYEKTAESSFIVQIDTTWNLTESYVINDYNPIEAVRWSYKYGNLSYNSALHGPYSTAIHCEIGIAEKGCKSYLNPEEVFLVDFTIPFAFANATAVPDPAGGLKNDGQAFYGGTIGFTFEDDSRVRHAYATGSYAWFQSYDPPEKSPRVRLVTDNVAGVTSRKVNVKSVLDKVRSAGVREVRIALAKYPTIDRDGGGESEKSVSYSKFWNYGLNQGLDENPFGFLINYFDYKFPELEFTTADIVREKNVVRPQNYWESYSELEKNQSVYLKFGVTGTYSMDYTLERKLCPTCSWKQAEINFDDPISTAEMLEGKTLFFKVNGSDLDSYDSVTYRLKMEKVGDDGYWTSQYFYSNELVLRRLYNVNAKAVDENGEELFERVIELEDGTKLNIPWTFFYGYDGTFNTKELAIGMSERAKIFAPRHLNDYEFLCWLNSKNACASEGMKDTIDVAVSKDTTLVAKFMKLADFIDSRQMYVSSYTRGSEDPETYKEKSAPKKFDYHYGEDKVTVHAKVVRQVSKTNGYAVLQKRVDGGGWTRVSSKFISSETSYYFEDDIEVPNSVFSGGKSIELRIGNCATAACSGSEDSFSNEVYFLVQRKVVLDCSHSHINHCYEAGINFVDVNGQSLGNADSRWFHYGETVRLSSVGVVDYVLNGWLDPSWNTVSNEQNLEFVIDDENIVKFNNNKELWVTVDAEYKYLNTSVATNSVPKAGQTALYFFQNDGDLILMDGHKLLYYSDGRYVDYDIEAENGLRPGTYNAILTFGIQNESAKSVVASERGCSFGPGCRSIVTVNGKEASLSTDEPYDGGATIKYVYYFRVDGKTINFMDGENVVTVRYAPENGFVAAPATSPTKAGYEFVGWFVSEAEDAEEYNFSTPVTTDMNLYAKWTANETDFGAITIAADRSSATIDGTSDVAVADMDGIEVSGDVTLNRSYVAGKYSTVMLPFATSASNVPGVSFYGLHDVVKKDGEWQVQVSPVSEIQANTPYIVVASGDASNLVVTGGVTFNTTTGTRSSTAGNWQFVGTYEFRNWDEDQNAEEIGTTYGFASAEGDNDGVSIGTFGKVKAGAYIYPLRAYLRYVPVVTPKPASALAKSRTVASIDNLPESMDVVIVGGDSDEETTVIGTINTRTGEFRNAGDRWFDLKGRFLGVKRPTAKGTYYNNGKKVIVR